MRVLMIFQQTQLPMEEPEDPDHAEGCSMHLFTFLHKSHAALL